MLKKTVLENGLKIVTKKLENTKSATVLILVGAGSRYEVKEINGISHFLEHMFFKGAEKYKNTKEVSEAIDGVGGDFNAFTGKEYAGYYVKVADRHVGLAVDVLADMLIHSKFDAAEIDKERGVIMEEYNMYQDTPMYQIGWDFERLIYGNQPLGWDQVGTKEVIMGITREQFVQYKNELYTPENTVIALAGNVDHDQVLEQIKKLFVFGQNKKAYNFLPAKKLEAVELKNRLYLRNKKTEQAHIMVGFPGLPEEHPDHYAAKMLAIVLGGNMSSRMFLNVREAQGLAYYISSTTDDYTDTGTFCTNAGVSVERIDMAITAVINEYKKCLQDSIPVTELKKAQEFFKGKMVLRLEDSEEFAHLLGKNELLYNSSLTPDEVIQKIDAVKPEDLMRVAQNLIKEERLYLAVIGPYDNEQRFLDLMKF